MGEQLLHSALHALQDTAKLLPFLFLTYLLMEILEKKAGDKAEETIRRAGLWGPVLGGVLGAVPQCGFSAAASSLYAGRVITVGTLLSVFWSTSDEMVPIMLSGMASGQASGETLLWLLLAKVVIGAVSGVLVDLFVRVILRSHREPMDIHSLCEQEHCDCEESVWTAALKHTVKIALYLLVIGFGINFLIELIGEAQLAAWFTDLPIVGVLVSALIGLIPNCVASVTVTQLYLDGVISAGALLAGLLTGAGVGLLVLFRLNRRRVQNAWITAALLFVGVLWGLAFDAIGIVF